MRLIVRHLECPTCTANPQKDPVVSHGAAVGALNRHVPEHRVAQLHLLRALRQVENLPRSEYTLGKDVIFEKAHWYVKNSAWLVRIGLVEVVEEKLLLRLLCAGRSGVEEPEYGRFQTAYDEHHVPYSILLFERILKRDDGISVLWLGRPQEYMPSVALWKKGQETYSPYAQ